MWANMMKISIRSDESRGECRGGGETFVVNESLPRVKQTQRPKKHQGSRIISDASVIEIPKEGKNMRWGES
jgi:hypothetical protein